MKNIDSKNEFGTPFEFMLLTQGLRGSNPLQMFFQAPMFFA